MADDWLDPVAQARLKREREEYECEREAQRDRRYDAGTSDALARMACKKPLSPLEQHAVDEQETRLRTLWLAGGGLAVAAAALAGRALYTRRAVIRRALSAFLSNQGG